MPGPVRCSATQARAHRTVDGAAQRRGRAVAPAALGGAVQVILTAPRGELAGIVSRALADEAVGGDGPRVVIYVALQAPNSLLHAGHAWKRSPPERLLAKTRAAVRRASRADFLIHASYVLAGSDAAGLRVGKKLRPIGDAALQAA